MSQPGSLDHSPGLVQPYKARHDLSELVTNELGLPVGSVDVKVSSVARVHASRVCKGDVALMMAIDGPNVVAGRVWVFVSVDGVGDFVFASLFSVKSQDKEQGVALWHTSDNISLCELTDVLCSIIWRDASAGVVRTLAPYEFRGFDAVSE